MLDDVCDEDWATWTSRVGFPVMGIWGKGMRFANINHCYRSHSGAITVHLLSTRPSIPHEGQCT